MLQLQELLKRLHVLPLRAGEALQAMATTRHLSLSDSTTGEGAHSSSPVLHRHYMDQMHG